MISENEKIAYLQKVISIIIASKHAKIDGISLDIDTESIVDFDSNVGYYGKITIDFSGATRKTIGKLFDSFN
jgi:hypothetical protein